MGRFTFPKWINKLVLVFPAFAVLGGLYVLVLVVLGASPETTAVGYAPEQPVKYSHALHAGKLGLDCRYCHTTVHDAAHAAIPPTQTCMNCHATIRKDSKKLTLVRESHATGQPIEWVKVHDLADFAYFNHSAHVNRGIGCVSCHDRVDKMEVVYQAHPLNMGWCLDCHRNPEEHLRPLDKITEMDWEAPEGQQAFGARFRETHNINPSTDCSTCHR